MTECPKSTNCKRTRRSAKRNEQTADVLHSSIKTVEKHRQKVMEMLDIHDTASLTIYAIAAGIIESSVQVTIL